MAKPKTLIVRVYRNGKQIHEREVYREKGWSKKGIEEFVKGIKAGYPDDEIKTFTSTITDD